MEIHGIGISQSTQPHILVQFLSIFLIVLMPFCLTWTYSLSKFQVNAWILIQKEIYWFGLQLSL